MELMGYTTYQEGFFQIKREMPIRLFIENEFVQIEDKKYFYENIKEIEISHNHGYLGMRLDGFEDDTIYDGLGNFIRILEGDRVIKILFKIPSKDDYIKINFFLINLKKVLVKYPKVLFWISDTEIIEKILKTNNNEFLL